MVRKEQSMKPISIFLAISTVTLFAGCSTNRGGSANEFDTTSNVVGNSASPSFRPGMNPEDPRDAQFFNQPQPGQPTKP